jgi:hypothetical protein
VSCAWEGYACLSGCPACGHVRLADSGGEDGFRAVGLKGVTTEVRTFGGALSRSSGMRSDQGCSSCSCLELSKPLGESSEHFLAATLSTQLPHHHQLNCFPTTATMPYPMRDFFPYSAWRHVHRGHYATPKGPDTTAILMLLGRPYLPTSSIQSMGLPHRAHCTAKFYAGRPT